MVPCPTCVSHTLPLTTAATTSSVDTLKLSLREMQALTLPTAMIRPPCISPLKLDRRELCGFFWKRGRICERPTRAGSAHCTPRPPHALKGLQKPFSTMPGFQKRTRTAGSHCIGTPFLGLRVFWRLFSSTIAQLSKIRDTQRYSWLVVQGLTTACVNVLLKHGLDKARRDNFGRVTLDVAVKPRVRALLKPGGEVPGQETD